MRRTEVEEIKEKFGFLNNQAEEIHQAIHEIDWVLTGQMMKALLNSPQGDPYKRVLWEELIATHTKFEHLMYQALDVCELQFRKELAEAEANEEIEIEKGEQQ